MKPSGRFVIDGPGAAPRAVEFDENGTGDNPAHTYAPAIDAGRRFNTRVGLRPDQAAMLAMLKAQEQNDLLDKPATERTRILGDMAEAAAKAKTAPAQAKAAPKGDAS